MLERFRRDPLAIFPITPVLRNLADVDLGVEIRREGMAVAPAIAIEDIDGVDLIEELLLSVGAEDVRHARIEAGAEERHKVRLLEALAIGPLPFIFELRLVGRLVVRRIEIID